MMARCVFQHLTGLGAGVIAWVTLAACVGGCATASSRGVNPETPLVRAQGEPANSNVASVATPAPGLPKSDVVEVVARSKEGWPADIPRPLAASSLPDLEPAAAVDGGENVPAVVTMPTADPKTEGVETLDSGPATAGSADGAALSETGAPTEGPQPPPESSLPVIELSSLGAEVPADEPESDPRPSEVDVNVDLAGVVAAAAGKTPLVDESLLTAACTSCGQFHAGGQSGTFGGSCGPGGCIPGRTKPCYHAEHSTYIGRFASNLYHCLCCPDPCYEPTWVPEANASFFVDPARPRTQKKLRWDHGQTMWFPDRSEYFWARSFRGPGPQPRKPVTKNGKPIYGERTLNYDQLYIYMEAALKGFSFFTEIPYRSTSPDLTAHHAGFADMNIGTKSMVLDCDLMQLSLQFRTYLPIGSVIDGLGNGHVSLEPSLLTAIHLAPHTYLQGQIAEWIPLGGDPDYAGAILHYHLSLNHVLCRFMPDVPLIGTFEFNGWSFQDGAFTAPVLGPQNSSGTSYLSLGPGLRVSVCEYMDFGIGTAFALNSPNWSDALIRSEVRIFY